MMADEVIDVEVNKEDIVISVLPELFEIFPESDVKKVEDLLWRIILTHENTPVNGEWLKGTAVEALLSRPGDFRAERKRPRPEPTQERTVDVSYNDHAYILLGSEFPTVRADSIRNVLRKCSNNFTATYEHLDAGGPSIVYRASKRKQVIPENMSEKLAMEYDIVKKKKEEMIQGQTMECGCCFTPHPISFMAQCDEGCLFCRECLECYALEAMSQGKTYLPCMDTGGCKGKFPPSVLRRCLKKDTLKMMEDTELRLSMAKVGEKLNLVTCPFCQIYRAEITNPEDRVFRCANPECGKESCVLCGEEAHIPLRCDEVEKKDELNLRNTVEEAMTRARVRICPKCKREFIKSDGCNKIRCSCGQIMCYICRAVITGYEHFYDNNSRHPSAVYKGRCPLWTKDTQDDDLAIRDAGVEVEKRFKEKYPELVEKAISVLEEHRREMANRRRR